MKDKIKPTHPLLRVPLERSSSGRYTVIKDTREKDGQGWIFRETDRCAGMRRGTLATGDYTLAGFEDVVAIERKGCVAEFARNICEARFWRELERMKDYKVAALILEFTEADIMRWPAGSGIPKYKWKYIRITKGFILSSLKRIRKEYPTITVILAGSEGQAMARQLFQRSAEGGTKSG